MRVGRRWLGQQSPAPTLLFEFAVSNHGHTLGYGFHRLIVREAPAAGHRTGAHVTEAVRDARWLPHCGTASGIARPLQRPCRNGKAWTIPGVKRWNKTRACGA